MSLEWRDWKVAQSTISTFLRFNDLYNQNKRHLVLASLCSLWKAEKWKLTWPWSSCDQWLLVTFWIFCTALILKPCLKVPRESSFYPVLQFYYKILYSAELWHWRLTIVLFWVVPVPGVTENKCCLVILRRMRFTITTHHPNLPNQIQTRKINPDRFQSLFSGSVLSGVMNYLTWQDFSDEQAEGRSLTSTTRRAVCKAPLRWLDFANEKKSIQRSFFAFISIVRITM